MSAAALADAEAKRIALALILDAWEAARDKGVASELIASTAIFAALTDMVDLHGAEAVARFTEGLAPRLRAGEFTLSEDAD
jgi:hypothetical protein